MPSTSQNQNIKKEAGHVRQGSHSNQNHEFASFDDVIKHQD